MYLDKNKFAWNFKKKCSYVPRQETSLHDITKKHNAVMYLDKNKFVWYYKKHKCSYVPRQKQICMISKCQRG